MNVCILVQLHYMYIITIVLNGVWFCKNNALSSKNIPV